MRKTGKNHQDVEKGGGGRDKWRQGNKNGSYESQESSAEKWVWVCTLGKGEHGTFI